MFDIFAHTFVWYLYWSSFDCHNQLQSASIEKKQVDAPPRFSLNKLYDVPLPLPGETAVEKGGIWREANNGWGDSRQIWSPDSGQLNVKTPLTFHTFHIQYTDRYLGYQIVRQKMENAAWHERVINFTWVCLSFCLFVFGKVSKYLSQLLFVCIWQGVQVHLTQIEAGWMQARVGWTTRKGVQLLFSYLKINGSLQNMKLLGTCLSKIYDFVSSYCECR